MNAFIDILLEKNEIGKNVLKQMFVDISNDGFNDMKQAQINKKSAKLFEGRNHE